MNSSLKQEVFCQLLASGGLSQSEQYPCETFALQYHEFCQVCQVLRLTFRKNNHIIEYMHQIQHKLLQLVHERNLGRLTLDEIGDLVGIRPRSPQKVKHHLYQLEKRGLIRVDKSHGIIQKTGTGSVAGLLRRGKLFAIPILGAASAGHAELFAEANIEGYLRVSNTLIDRQSVKGLFSLKVRGPSMNRAIVAGKRIEDGDYVIIDSQYREPRDGDIVLSIIDGMANIKRFHSDKTNRQIVLISESTHDIPPIYIHEDDDYIVNGRVIQVIKKPSTT